MRASTAALLFLAAVCQVVVRGVNASSATFGKLMTPATPLGKVRHGVPCAIAQSLVHACVPQHDTVHGGAVMALAIWLWHDHTTPAPPSGTSST